MARWTGQANTAAILDAAARWRDRCLLSDGSVLTDQRAWTAEATADLNTRVALPTPEVRGFDARLVHQVKEAPNATIIVAAETLWLLMLYPRGTYAPANKRRKILGLLKPIGLDLPATGPLSDEVLDGIGGGGMGFATGIGDQWSFLVDALARWKQVALAERQAIMADREGWAFARWLDTVPKADRRGMRHALLYLLFPDTFERAISQQHKREHYALFHDRLAGAENSAPKALGALDRGLLEIRRKLEADYNTRELDFYLPPLHAAPAAGPQQPAEVETEGAGPGATTHEMPPTGPVLFVEPEEMAEIEELLQRKRNVIFHGPPGTGKTLVARQVAIDLAGDSARVTMVQFHQSVGYEDFIVGWRATESGFALHDGRFKSFCAQAASAPDKPHVFVIDEINRGNLSRIFGETLLLIEADKRGPGNAVTLAANGERFFVPQNLFVIGMMNTADRSLAVVDYALRRRFAFFEMRPRFESTRFTDALAANDVPDRLARKICGRLPALNRAITADTATLGAGFAVGHSFFCTPPGDDPDAWYKQIIERELRPLLEEYWFDRPDKAEAEIQALLRD